MRMIRLLTVAAVLIIGLNTVAAAYEETRDMQLPAGGVKRLEVTCGAGLLEIIGRDGVTDIRVRAEIEIERTGRSDAREIIEERLDLSLERRGDHAVLVSRFDNDNFGFWRNIRGDMNVRVNLTVIIPAGLDVDIDDGSGDTSVSNVGYAKIEDGSGNLAVNNAGGLSIDDGSGDIVIEDISGDITIDDGSGNITIAGAAGIVQIDDGSGNIEVREVGDGVVIDDGSGNIEMSDITGDVHVDDESGDTRVADVRGSVEVRDGSGSIDIRRVTGDLVVREDGSGGIVVNDVEGRVRIPEH